MNLEGKKFAGMMALALFGAMSAGTATAQVVTLHGNQATQQVTYSASGGTLDPLFPVQVQHELDASGSRHVVRATYVTQDSLLINVGDNRCLGLKKKSGHDALVAEACRDDGSQVFRRVGERLEIAGLCLDSAFVPGVAHVVAVTCNGGSDQRWLRQSDGAIRMASAPGCFTSGDASSDTVKIETCVAGALQQRFLTLAP